MTRAAPLVLLPLLAACAARPLPPDRQAHVPPFARIPYEAFSRTAVVAVALREWRLFGLKVDDDPPGQHPPPQPGDKPERQDGMWQRVGEYWWLGLDAGSREQGWTGKHDGQGRMFGDNEDEDFAWSAAFVSYVMRIAGAGPRFPYSAAHHVYIDAAWQTSQGRAGWLVTTEAPERYPPQPGDLICMSRTALPVRYAMLPAGRFPAHCDIVVAANPGVLDVVGGNVDDAVTLKHVPVTEDGRLATADGTVIDPRYPWFVVLRALAER